MGRQGDRAQKCKPKRTKAQTLPRSMSLCGVGQVESQADPALDVGM